jgi:ABC-type transporter Mla subunit MlaD
MLTAVQAAAVAAATAFTVLAIAGVYALVKLVRLISAATGAVAGAGARGDLLAERANSAVDRAHEQLARTDAITASMDEVAANIAELSDDVSLLTGAVRTLLGGPIGKLAAFSFGVRHAIGRRRGGAIRDGSARLPQPAARATAADPRDVPAALPAARIAAPGRDGRRPAGQAPRWRQRRRGSRTRAPR